jgi:hypothetical protein
VRWENDEYGNTYQIVTDRNDPLANPVIRNVGQLSRNYRSGGSSQEKPQTVYTEKTLPVATKNDIVATIQQNPGLLEKDLYATFPEVDEAVLLKYYDQHYKEAEQGAETEEDTPWWKFWE